ncbi:MAG: rhomboid family intramembrane serine protease [Planctomycetota bacterium]|nr:MAG: rhomboid family intramembrane serine protease [Planctomycetota bacterium]
MVPIADNVPRRNPPITTWSLIAANVFVFALMLGADPNKLERFVYLFGIVPARYTHPDWAQWVGFPADDYWPFLTSMFLHGGWLHIISNMWVLWLFGDNVEDRMGPVRFLIFYLLCGVIAGAVHWFTNADSTVPTVGASGAIAGVIAAYAVLFPHARIVVMIPLFFIFPLFIDIHALLFAAVWFFSQMFSGTLALLGPQQVGGVAWWAHVGGFVAGLALVGLFVPRERPRTYADHAVFERAWTGRL